MLIEGRGKCRGAWGITGKEKAALGESRFSVGELGFFQPTRLMGDHQPENLRVIDTDHGHPKQSAHANAFAARTYFST